MSQVLVEKASWVIIPAPKFKLGDLVTYYIPGEQGLQVFSGEVDHQFYQRSIGSENGYWEYGIELDLQYCKVTGELHSLGDVVPEELLSLVF